MFAPQVPGVFGALAYRRAAFEHDGFETHLRQQQRGKHAAGPKAHHHRAQGQRGRGLAHRVVGHVRRGAYVRMVSKLGQQALLQCGVQRHVHDKHGQQIGLARVKAALEDVQALDVVHRHAQRLRGHAGKRGQRVRRGAAVFVGFTGGVGGAPGIDRQGGQGEFEFGDSQHIRGSELSSKAPIIRKGFVLVVRGGGAAPTETGRCSGSRQMRLDPCRTAEVSVGAAPSPRRFSRFGRR